MIKGQERLNRSFNQDLVGFQGLPCGAKPGTEKSGVHPFMVLRVMLAVFNSLGSQDATHHQ